MSNWSTLTEHFVINTPQRYAILDITEQVEAFRARARLHDGIILVSTMHITRCECIYVNESEL